MKLERIDFDAEEALKSVTVTMTVEEAAVVYWHCGSIAPMYVTKATGEERFGAANDEVASCLSGTFFNRFYDGGVHEVLAKFTAEDLVAAKRDSQDG